MAKKKSNNERYDPNVPRSKWPLPKGRRVYFVSHECGQPFEIQEGFVNFYLRDVHLGYYFYNIRADTARLVSTEWVRVRNAKGKAELLVKMAKRHQEVAGTLAEQAAAQMVQAMKCLRLAKVPVLPCAMLRPGKNGKPEFVDISIDQAKQIMKNMESTHAK